MYKNHIITTKNELLTSGFRIPSRPTHDGADYVDVQRKERISDVGILAFADGTVVSVRFGNSVGWNVDILHAGGFLTRYCHMKDKSVQVKKGDKVKQGQTVGIMGTTGDSTGIHLHFAIKESVKEDDADYKNDTYYMRGSYVNPEPYLKGEKNMPVQQPETKNITVTFGATKYILDGESFDEPTLVYNGVAYLPAAYLATKLGLMAKWDAETNTTTLTSGKKNG